MDIYNSAFYFITLRCFKRRVAQLNLKYRLIDIEKAGSIDPAFLFFIFRYSPRIVLAFIRIVSSFNKTIPPSGPGSICKPVVSPFS